MKGIVSFVVLASFLSYSVCGSDIVCPPHNGQNVTLIANPANCKTYFACETGVPVLMNCPAGLHFNDLDKVCDSPALACCDLQLDPEHKCPNNPRPEN